jgi:hypothetical protein
MGDNPAHGAAVFPEALETFLRRMGELRAVLGPGAADGVTRLEALVAEGLAASDRGDVPAAVARVVEAMRLLAAIASGSGAAEGAMLAAMADRFAQALGRGALDEARAHADVMRATSGTTIRPKR